MSYNKQNFVSGQTLKAEHINNIEDGIVANETAINTKQDELVSGSNIKTVNGESILGEGNIEINNKSQRINNAVFFGDSITHGVYSYFNADGGRENGFDTTDEGHPRIPACFGELSGANVTNNGKRGSGWVIDTRNIGSGLEMTQQTNFADYDFVAYCLGINDWIQGAPLGSFTDSLSEAQAAQVMSVSEDTPVMAMMSMRSISATDTDTTIDVTTEGEEGTPIETTLSQGYASNGTINDTQTNRVRTDYIQPPYYIEVNENYRIRAIMGYKTNDGVTTEYTAIKGTSTTATSYTIEDTTDYDYHIITFANADATATISPTEDIIKELRTPGTLTEIVTVTGGTVAGTEPVVTELVNGAASIDSTTGATKILAYDGNSTRVRTLFVQPPYHIETNEGYVIRAIMAYTHNDYTSGTGIYITDSANTQGTSYTIETTYQNYQYPYHMITFTKVDDTAAIAPDEEIIKKFYVHAEDESDLVTKTTIEVHEEVITGNTPIETTITQGYASSPINHTATNRVKTGMIQPPYHIETNEGYVIRAIYAYATKDSTSGIQIAETSTTATSYDITTATNMYHMITFAKADATAAISPTEDIIKSLCTLDTTITTADITGGSIIDTTPIATELVNGVGTYRTSSSDGSLLPQVLFYDNKSDRVRTEFIQAPFHIETYRDYIIRSIVGYSHNDKYSGTCKKIFNMNDNGPVSSYTVSEVDEEYPACLVTFSKINGTDDISPSENIIKKLYTPASDVTVSEPVSIVGTVKDGEDGISIHTTLSQGFASVIFDETLTNRAKTSYIQPPYYIEAGDGYVIRSIYAYPTNDGSTEGCVEIQAISTTSTSYEVTESSDMYHVITFAKTDETETLTLDGEIVKYLYIPIGGEESGGDDSGEEEGGDDSGGTTTDGVDFTGGAIDGYEPITTRLVNGAGSYSGSVPAITKYDGQSNRLRTEFIEAPFYVEVNSGYTIRAVVKYTNNDYTTGAAATLTSSTSNSSFTVSEVDTAYPYYLITFTNTDATLDISPTEDVVKYLCKPVAEDGGDNDDDIEYGDSVTIIGAVKGIETTLTQGYGSTNVNNTQTNRVKTGYIQPPYFIEVNEGYVIRAIYSYDTEDSTTGGTQVRDTSTTATSYKVTDTTGYHIITFASADDPNTEIQPNTGIVKYLYSLSSNDNSDSGSSIDNLKGKHPIMEEGTVIGNMCLCFQQIAQQNPLCKIVVYSPYNAWGQVSVGGDYVANTYYGDEETNYALGANNKAGYTLQDLICVIDKVCKYYGIAHVPLSQSNICNRLTIKNIMIDGLHPSREARPFLAAEIFGKKGFDC